MAAQKRNPMKLKCLVSVAALVLLLQGGVSLGAAQHLDWTPHSFVVYGPSTNGVHDSCGAWTSANPSTREAYDWWAMGFISGAGYAATAKLAATDADGLEAWMTKYCVDHPLDPIVKAATTLVNELKARAR